MSCYHKKDWKQFKRICSNFFDVGKARFLSPTIYYLSPIYHVSQSKKKNKQAACALSIPLALPM